jgi:hypothetical protein
LVFDKIKKIKKIKSSETIKILVKARNKIKLVSRGRICCYILFQVEQRELEEVVQFIAGRPFFVFLFF